MVHTQRAWRTGCGRGVACSAWVACATMLVAVADGAAETAASKRSVAVFAWEKNEVEPVEEAEEPEEPVAGPVFVPLAVGLAEAEESEDPMVGPVFVPRAVGLTYAPDDRIAVVDRAHRTILVLEETGDVQARLGPGPRNVRWGPQRAGDLSTEIRLLLDGDELPPPRSPHPIELLRALQDVAFLPDGRCAIVWARPRRVVRVYDITEDALLVETQNKLHESIAGGLIGEMVTEVTGWVKLRMAILADHPEYGDWPPVSGVSLVRDSLVVSVADDPNRCFWFSPELDLLRETLGSHPGPDGRSYGLGADNREIITFSGHEEVSRTRLPANVSACDDGVQLVPVQLFATSAGLLVLELAEDRAVEILERPPSAPALSPGRVAVLSPAGDVEVLLNFHRQATDEPLPCCGFSAEGRLLIPDCGPDALEVLEVTLSDE